MIFKETVKDGNYFQILEIVKDNCAKIVSSGRWQMKRTYARILNEAQDTACESLSAGR